MEKYKRLIISDLHLGSEHSNTEKFLHLIKHIQFDELVLNGDIIDLIILRNKKFKNWPIEHSVVLQKILKYIRHGGRVVWIRGNHEDKLLNSFMGEEISGIYFCEEYSFDKTLIYHGDKLDFLVRGKFQKLSTVGAFGYEMLLNLNKYLNKIFRIFNKSFSLSSFIKKNTKKIIQYITSFETFAAEEAKLRGFNTVILGHIHQNADKKINAIRYMNTGCWINDGDCHYIVQNMDGTLELKQYI